MNVGARPSAPERESRGRIDGIIVIDKPEGPTSHDVVAKLRRTLQEKAIGHAGTLDPMATGVLVIAVGQGTKLVPYLSGHAKCYRAVIELGRGTTTDDREGETVLHAPVPPQLRAWTDELAGAFLDRESGARFPHNTLAQALAAELSRTEQVPPIYSAIHHEGVRAHTLARRGEEVTLAPRSVSLVAVRVISTGNAERCIELDVKVSKGYYVRALARDLGGALGSAGHLRALVRTHSGPFSLADAARWDLASADLGVHVISLARAASLALPSATLGEEGGVKARQGKRLYAGDFVVTPPDSGCAAWLDRDGELIAIGEPAEAEVEAEAERAEFRVRRGFLAGLRPDDPIR